MTSRTRTQLLATAAIAAATVGAAVTAGPAAATGATTLRPPKLAQGPGPAVPQVVGNTILDGERTVEVRARDVQMLGRSGEDYVVATYGRRGARVERVSTDGARRTVLTGIRDEVDLAANGRRLVETEVSNPRHSVVRIRNARTGKRLVGRQFRGAITVLDSKRHRLLLGGTSPDRTFWWNPGKDRTRRLLPRTAYFADVDADRLAYFTADPYDGGCSVLASVSAPREASSRSCRWAVLSSSPDGARVVTAPLLADGPLGQVEVRRAGGHRVAAYRAPYRFGALSWEDDRSLLLVTHAKRRAAVARCDVDTRTPCERAGRVVRARP